CRFLSPGGFLRCHAGRVSRTGEQPPGNPAAGPDEGKPAGEVPGFDQRRARARLALLDQELTLAEALKDLEEASARPAPPPGTDDTWAPTRARAERAAAQVRHWISKLAPVVGDPESVTDEHGLLPATAGSASRPSSPPRSTP